MTVEDRIVLALTAFGMIASLVMFFTLRDAEKSQVTGDQLLSTNMVKSQLYYVAHATQLILLLSAGLVALLSTDWRTIERGYSFRLALLFGAALLMALRGYSFSELASTKIVDTGGPFPFFMSVLVFVGARRSNWVVLGKAIEIMALVFSALVLLRVAGLSPFPRQEGVVTL